MICTPKFDFAVHLCTVWLIEKPEAVSCQLLAGVLLDFIWLSIRITGAACDDQFFIRLDIFESLDQISNTFLRHQTTEEQYVGVFFQSKIIRDQLCILNLCPIDTIRDKMCLPPVRIHEILLHALAQNDDLVRIFHGIFFALTDKFGSKP